MSGFDPQAFAGTLLEGVRTLVKTAGGNDARDLRARLAALQADVESTFEALETEPDPVRVRALRDDLERALPVRRAALLSVAESHMASQERAELEAALDLVVKVAVIAAHAFVGA